MFRGAFGGPVRFCVGRGWAKKRGKGTRVLGLVVAFGMSGVMHLSGSVTQFGDTNPSHPLIFFLLQGLGIIFQTSFISLFASTPFTQKQNKEKEGKKWWRRMGNFFFVFAWLLWTAPWLIDDFARGGLWLFEPVPVSFVRGVRGEGWACWGGGVGVGVGFYRGVRWWESGLVLW